MAVHRVVLTYEDYLAMPDDGRRYEILDGEVAVSASPATLHQRSLPRAVHGRPGPHHGRRAGSGVRRQRPSRPGRRARHAGGAEPADRGAVAERGGDGSGPEVPALARYGVPCYWMVDTDARALEAYELGAEGYRLVDRVQGTRAVSLPPFSDLAFVPDELWRS